MTPAERNRRHRRRQKDGLAVWCIEVDEIKTTQDLIAGGHLDPARADDRAAAEAALSRAVRAWVVVPPDA